MSETTGNSAALEKIPQPHGGALNRGGTPGNKGGRPPSVVRALSREKYADHIKTLDRIAKSRKASNADRVRAINVMGKYGMDQSVSMSDVKRCVDLTLEEIREFLPRDQAEALIQKIAPHWIGL